eukprot:COSAG01_NODE_2556_length_7460_cov_14.297786_3_plen_56_part_00
MMAGETHTGAGGGLWRGGLAGWLAFAGIGSARSERRQLLRSRGQHTAGHRRAGQQ